MQLLQPLAVFTPALMGMVIGHWAQDGQLHMDSHCCGHHHNVFICDCWESLINEIVFTFSFECQTVIDAIEDSGKKNSMAPYLNNNIILLLDNKFVHPHMWNTNLYSYYRLLLFLHTDGVVSQDLERKCIKISPDCSLVQKLSEGEESSA